MQSHCTTHIYNDEDGADLEPQANPDSDPAGGSAEAAGARARGASARSVDEEEVDDETDDGGGGGASVADQSLASQEPE